MEGSAKEHAKALVLIGAKALARHVGINAKALVPLAAIVIAFIAQSRGYDVGLETHHYISLLVADFFVWLTPNKPNKKKDDAQNTKGEHDGKS